HPLVPGGTMRSHTALAIALPRDGDIETVNPDGGTWR
ncbi:MAG: hypothetical protein QOD86_3001, partial [Miltoncostaeaceae bacterium]|nr:hypothetical protein [Miltoncostaeaceae bacterium]